MATYREAAVELMRKITSEGRPYVLGGGHYWYSPDTTFVYEDVFGVSVSIPAGAMDCSGAVSSVYKALGLLDKGTVYSTSVMADLMCATGYFIYHDWSDSYVMRPGDLALRSYETGHVAMCMDSSFTLAEFLPNEGGDPDEPYYDFGWNICLELSDAIGNMTWSESGSGGGTGSSIDEDGLWGRETTRALQNHYGTTPDGEVWHQWAPNIRENPVLVDGWLCDDSLLGSPVIRAIQSNLGVAPVDGIMGQDTITAINNLFAGNYVADKDNPDTYKYLSTGAVWEIQHQLNGGVWPLQLSWQS